MKKFGSFVLVLALAACGKSPEVSSQPTSQKANDSWQSYEDAWIKVSYPPGSELVGAPGEKQDLKNPQFGVVPPESEFGVHGAFTLQLDSKTKGMLLRDAMQSEMNSKKELRANVLTSAKEIKVENGRCLVSALTWPFDRCPKDEGQCFAASLITLCDDFAGQRYSATTMLSRSKAASALSPKAQQQAATYERILRSLEFKKS